MGTKNKKNILLVEDEAILAITQKMTLEKYGYNVITANNGEKAIDVFRTTKDIDLILMDIDLGSGIDGPETATIILTEREIPVVFLSSHTEPEVVEKTEKITSYGYVVKNSGITVLDASIKMAFKLFYANQKIVESELTIRRKLNVITDPDEDIGELSLGDIIDYEAVQILMEKFYRITHIVSAILDISGNILVAYGWQDICTKFHRENPETLKNCIESDVCLSSGVPAGTFKAYKCKNNLWDMATPIEVGGKHLGNIYLGQFFYKDEIPDYELFRNQARQYGFNEKEYISALERVPHYSRETIEATMEFYSNLAALISSLSYSKIKLSRALAQHDISLLQLKESEAKYISYVDNAPDGIFVVDEKGNYLEANKAASQITGYTKEELLQMSISDITAGDFSEADFTQFKTVLETGNLKRESKFKHKDCSIRWWAVDAVKVADSRYIGFVKDITNLKQVETELKIKIEEIEATNEELNAAMEEMEATNEMLLNTTAELEVSEKTLLDEKVFTEALFESIPGYLYVYDDKGNLIRWNKKHETMTGYSSEELLQMNMSNWFEGEDAIRVARSIEEVMTTGYGEVEANLLTKSGKKLLIHSNGVRLILDGKTYFTGVGMDVTEQRRVEDEILQQKTLLNNIIESASDAIFAKDVDGHYRVINEAGARMLGYRAAEVIGRKDSDLLTAETADEFRRTDEYVMSSGRVYEREEKGVIGGKTSIFIAHKAPWRDNAGKITGIIGLSNDITERKLAEVEIKNLLAEKEIILKETHHRIRNFMNTISGLIFLQSESLQDPIAISALKNTDSRIKSMMLLYNKLYTSNNFNEISVMCYLPSLIDEIISSFPNMESVKIVKNIGDFIIKAKKIQPIGIIINELLTNIMKYAFTRRSDGIITITTELRDNHAVIVIQDNGVGIPESTSFENSPGFGMQLIKMLSEQIEARIRIERGEGTKFVLEFDV